MSRVTVLDAGIASTPEKTEVLIIGAGPFGLSLAARLRAQGVPFRLVGDTMCFWRQNMPAGMFLRSSWDWYLDPQGIWTIERFLAARGLAKSDVNPIPIDVYLDYVEWFRQGSQLDPENIRIMGLDQIAGGSFVATTSTNERIGAKKVVLALGFSSFTSVPEEIVSLLPPETTRHTLDAVDFSAAADKRFLIIGGRQSAFEWAALLAEAGAQQVHLAHRHSSPAFAEADWSWVPPLMEQMVADPAWFRSLSAVEKQGYIQRLWGEGRLKVEPWLEARIAAGPVSIWPQSTIETATPSQMAWL